MVENHQQLGKYEILEKIGEGGFGTVYRGRDPLLDREVAIKVLSAEKAAAPDFVERFRREARLAASLRHPNIVTVIEVGEQDGRYYMVMDYLPGGSLRQRMTAGQPMPLSQAAALLRPIAEALDYAHSRNIIHRDVKPGNILFTEDDQPVLTDFGLVKSLGEREDITTTGMTLGTVEYMSPEQIQGLEVGPASDRYALGVVAYQLLTGRAPFQGNTPFEIQKGHVQEQPPDPRQLNPGLPVEAAAVLQKALVKNPEGRYESAVKFVGELEFQAARYTMASREALVQEAVDAMERRDFTGAVQKFEQAQGIQSTPDVAGLLAESRRRDDIWRQHQDLRARQLQLSAHLAELSAQESWLPGEPGRDGGQSGTKTPDLVNTRARRGNILLLGGSTAGIVSMLLTWMFINSSPLENVLRGFPQWQSFAYAFDYRIIQGLTILSILCYFTWLVVRLIPGSRATSQKNSSAEQQSAAEKYLLAGAIIASLASMVFSWIWIQRAPVEDAVRQTPNWGSFSYAIDYLFILAFTILSILFFAVWVLFEFPKPRNES